MSKLLTSHSRRGLAVALALAAMLWLAACGGSGKTASSQTSASSHTSAAAEAPTNQSAINKRYPHKTLLAAARVGVITLTDCLRERGIKVPPQRISGPNPIFSAKGINTTTAQYRSAFPPCYTKALAKFHARLRKG